MGIKSKIKKSILVILLVSVSFILSAIGLFSNRGDGKTNQAQATCWTAPGGGCGGGGGCACVGCAGCGCNSGGCASGCGCGCGCSACGCGGCL